MSKGSGENTTLAQAVLRLGEIIVEDGKGQKKQLSKLTDAVHELTVNAAENKKDREHHTKQQDRFEENQRAQGKEIKNLSDHVILLDERMGVAKSKWDAVDKIKLTVSAALIAASILIYLGLK